MFSKDLINALRKARREKDQTPLEHVIKSWLAYAELETIPGFRKEVWKAHSEKDKDCPSWKEFRASLRSSIEK